MPHVCIFTSAHPTDDVRVNTRMATAFQDAGYRVSWVGPEHAYFSEEVRVSDEIAYHLFRPNNTRGRRLTASRAAARAATALQDVDWWYCPDPDAAGTAVGLARRQGGRVLFDIHEAFHQGLLDRWFPGKAPRLVREAVRRRLGRTCRRVDLVTGVSRSVMLPYLSGGESVVVTRNCAPRMFEATEHSEGAAGGRLRVMHGKAVRSNGTGRVFEALRLLSPRAAAEIQVHFTRVPTDDEFSSFVDEGRRGATDVNSSVLRDGVPHQLMPQLLGSQDVGMIAYQRDLGIESLPNRLFEYMAAGLAILAPSYSPEIVRIIEVEEIGIHADFEDPQAIADALTWLTGHRDEVAAMGARAREAFLSQYNWDIEAARLVEKMRGMES